MRITRQVLQNSIDKINKVKNLNLSVVYNGEYTLYNNKVEIIKGTSFNVYSYLQGMLYVLSELNLVDTTVNEELPKEVAKFLEFKKSNSIVVNVRKKALDSYFSQHAIRLNIVILDFNNSELSFMASLHTVTPNGYAVHDSEFDVGYSTVNIKGVSSIKELLERILKVIDDKHIDCMVSLKDGSHSAGIIWITDTVLRRMGWTNRGLKTVSMTFQYS